MAAQSRLHTLFPSPVLQSFNVLTEDENDALYGHIMSRKDSVSGQGEKAWLSGDRSPINSFRTRLDDPEFDLILRRVGEHVHLFARQLKSQGSFELNDWWYNVYHRDSLQEYHHHIPDTFSCIYYCRSPEGSSPTVFMNPVQGVQLPKSSLNWLDCNMEKFDAVERSLLVWRSHLLHCVQPGRNAEPRVTLAFNYR